MPYPVGCILSSGDAANGQCKNQNCNYPFCVSTDHAPRAEVAGRQKVIARIHDRVFENDAVIPKPEDRA